METDDIPYSDSGEISCERVDEIIVKCIDDLSDAHLNYTLEYFNADNDIIPYERESFIKGYLSCAAYSLIEDLYLNKYISYDEFLEHGFWLSQTLADIWWETLIDETVDLNTEETDNE